jgi:hypothetical protein
MEVLRSFQPTLIKEAGGTVDPIDRYFEENKAALVSEPDSPPDVAQAVARSALKAAGFPVDNAAAFDEAMGYLGVKIMIERMRAHFVAGTMTE